MNVTQQVEIARRRSDLFNAAFMKVHRAGVPRLADDLAIAGIMCRQQIDALIGPPWERCELHPRSHRGAKS